jgi:two-component system, chemotaxis family, response regulator WspR
MSADNQPDLTPASPAAYPVTVLLVDDQLLVGEAVRRALVGEPNLSFHFCDDPTKAIENAKALRPTVILQDLIMPNVNGLELVRRYRSEPSISLVPIIVLSTKEEASIKSDAFKAGANDYLVKLPDRVELVARIRYHSMAYVNQLQRDEAFRALRKSQQQLMETNLELEKLTNVDGLTGLSNRRHFNDYIDSEWKRALRSKNPLSVLMVDIDNFKQYNDTYGHLAGDDVLRKVANAIKQCGRRSTDVAARYGGEEFVVVLPETPFGELQGMGDRLCAAIAAVNIPHAASAVAKYVTISVGGATSVPRAASSHLALIEVADKALYASKRAGKNRATVVEEEFAADSAA